MCFPESRSFPKYHAPSIEEYRCSEIPWCSDEQEYDQGSNQYHLRDPFERFQHGSRDQGFAVRMRILTLLQVTQNRNRRKIDDESNDEQDNCYTEQGTVVFTADRYLTHFNTQCCGKCPYGRQDIPDGVRDDCRVTGNHHDGHCLTNCPADTKDNGSSNAGKGCRHNDPADGLPPCRPDCKGAFPEIPGNCTDGVF